MTQENSNVDFRDTPLWSDVESVITNGPKLVTFTSEIRIHTEKGDFNVLKVIEFQEKADYVQDFCASAFIRFYIGLGDFVYKLQPFRNMLEVTIRKVPQTFNEIPDPEAIIESVRYRAIMSSDKNSSITGKRVGNLDYNTLQTSNDLVEVCLELLDRNIEVLRVATVPGYAYRDVTPKQLISGLLVGQSQKYLVDGKPAIQALNFVEPDNSAPMKTAIIESNTKIANIPTFVQEKMSGVYSTGLGTFYQRVNDIPAWFVYPLFNNLRFDQGGERLVIFAVPEGTLSGMDKTYRRAGQVTYIVATGNNNYSDDSQVSDLNSNGVGFRQTDASAIITKPVELTTNGPITDRARLNREVAGRDRRDGVFYAPSVKPSVNPFKDYSRTAAQLSSTLEMIWENSNSDLILPGMPCKYVFMDSGEYREIKGTVLGKYTVSALSGAAGTTSTYRTSTALKLSLEYYSKTPEQPTEVSPGNY